MLHGVCMVLFIVLLIQIVNTDQSVNNPKKPGGKAKNLANPINSASMQIWI